MMARMIVAIGAIVVILVATQVAGALRRARVRRSADGGPPGQVLVFTGPGCPMCEAQSRQLALLEPSLRRRITVLDVVEHAATAEEWQVRSLPTLISFGDDGDPRAVVTGLVPEIRLRSILSAP